MEHIAYPSFTTEERAYSCMTPPIVLTDFGLAFSPEHKDRQHRHNRPLMSPAYRSPELVAADLHMAAMRAQGIKPPPSSLTVSSKLDVYAAGVALSMMYVPRPHEWPYVPDVGSLERRISLGTAHACGTREGQTLQQCCLASMVQYLSTADSQRRPSAYEACMVWQDMLADLFVHTALRRRDAQARCMRLPKRNAWDRESGLMAKAMLATLGRAAVSNTGLGGASDRCVAAAGRARQVDTPSHELCGLLFVGGAWPNHAYREDQTMRPAPRAVDEGADRGCAAIEAAHVAASRAEEGTGNCLSQPRAQKRVTFGGYIGHVQDTGYQVCP